MAEQEPITEIRPEEGWSAWADRVIAWLVEHWGQARPCPYCGNPAWQVGNVVELPPSDGWPASPSVPIDGAYPAVQVICTNCAHTVLLNASSIRDTTADQATSEEPRSVYGHPVVGQIPPVEKARIFGRAWRTRANLEHGVTAVPDDTSDDATPIEALGELVVTRATWGLIPGEPSEQIDALRHVEWLAGRGLPFGVENAIVAGGLDPAPGNRNKELEIEYRRGNGPSRVARFREHAIVDPSKLR